MTTRKKPAPKPQPTSSPAEPRSTDAPHRPGDPLPPNKRRPGDSAAMLSAEQVAELDQEG